MYTSTSSAADERVYCPECHRATEVVLDHATGDTICTECALVLDAHYIDECSEWRNFADDGGGDDRDPSRVGASRDPFLNAKLSTVIVYSNKSSATGVGANALPRMSVRDADASAASENTLVDGFRGIADMADRLGLVATIRDLAKETFKKLYDAKGSPRGRKRDAVYAACLYIACRNLGMPRTYKELASVTAGGAESKKDIGKMTTHIKRLLGEEDGQVMDIGVVSASDYLRRFCSRLGLGNQEVRDAQEAVRKVEEGLDVRRNPESVAAAIIYMVVQRAGAGRSVKDVSVATGVAEGTIKEAHKDLSPHAQMLFG
ncbi:transcription initiation factor IIB-like [Hordeum vulgare subsp. vulgare]|uniref:TFIIB-type domain-containing protein n=3 Tax=Hordeum vulgare subsp. vulgare TaxID=112509 RepID=A0A8I6WVB3_HORVV|nr:transcription initiation factor IIB-like [Hordeum vulgare subsp. vulgare]XP_044962062.1 transcription initiation factor IIB-like [Hordeum vulgare subsp. vulgare]